jgi:dihydroneopterin aldolase
MNGIVGIHHHRIRCIIGVLPHERVEEQEILLDLKVRVNMASCIVSENVQETVNYVRMADICTELAQQKQFFLLEALASAILDQLFFEFPIQWGWICIKKPAVLTTADYPFIELERERL